MSLILEALRQIEARQPLPPAAVPPVTAEELAQFGLDRVATPWAKTAAATEVPAAPPEPAPEPSSLRLVVEEASPEVPAPAEAAAPVSGGQRQTPCDPQYGDLADQVLSRCREDRSQVLMLTSAGRGEGKTSVVVPLSLALADRLPREVLLVDANVHRPEVASRLSISPGYGLADVVSGRIAWRDAVCAASESHLHVLAGGDWRDGLSRADAIKITASLDEIRRQYPLVMLDAPSLEDPLIAPMVRACDGVYLVVPLGRTTRTAVRQAVAALDRCDGHLLGCIVLQ